MNVLLMDPHGTTQSVVSAKDVALIIQERREGELLFHAAERLRRQGKLAWTPKKDESRLVSASGVARVLHERGFRCGAGTVEEVERSVKFILDFAARSSQGNHRKTVEPADVNGSALASILTLGGR